MQVALIRALCVAALLPLLGGQAFAVSAYVTNEKGNSITILDVDRMEAIKTFPVGKRPRGIALSPDGARLYVCTSDDDVIQVYDTASLALLGRIATSDPEQIVLSPDGARIYVANEDDNLISIFDAQTRKSIAEVPVGVEPEGVAVSPDGKTIVATSETTNMAHFIDAAARKIVGNVLVGVIRVEVDGRFEAMAEAVDVGGVGVDVLPKRVRVLHQEAQGLRIVGRLDGAGRGERDSEVLAAGAARRILGPGADDHRLEDGLQPGLGIARGGRLAHRAAST